VNIVAGRIFLAVSIVIGLAVESIGVAEASNCKMVQIEEWPVRLEHNRLIVDGAINGQKIGVLLSTGSTTSLILRSAAERLGLNPKEVRDRRMIGIGGETHAEVAVVDEFKVGQAVRKGWRVLVGGEHDLGGDVDFILGEDFFHEVDVEFDLAHGTVRLFQPQNCEGSSLAYWATAGAGETEIEAVDNARPQIIFAVQINGQPIWAQLFSGIATSVLTKSEAARLGVTPETQGVVALGSDTELGPQPVESWAGPFESFAIGNEIIKNTTIRFADLGKDMTYTARDRIPKHALGRQSMLLGADFLRAHRLLVAHSQRKIYFTYADGPVFQRPSRVPAAAADAEPATAQPGIPAKTQ
jgi:predicted aspartyl protease